MEGQEPCGPSGSNPISVFGAVYSALKSTLGTAWNAATKDGTLAAAGRQGADEMGMALKAFPDTIQADEPGTIWNPTQGEIAAARNPGLPSPSEIAKSGKTVDGGKEANAKEDASLSPSSLAKANAASVYGPEQPMPSPSEVAREKGDVLMAEKGFVEREMERRAKAAEGNAENDQNERAKGRSLPEEQKEQEQERSRGR